MSGKWKKRYKDLRRSLDKWEAELDRDIARIEASIPRDDLARLLVERLEVADKHAPGTSRALLTSFKQKDDQKEGAANPFAALPRQEGDTSQ